MRSGLLASNRNNPKRYLLLSVLLPMLLVAVGWIVLEVHPFGTRQILVTDFKSAESADAACASIHAARYRNRAGTAENRGSRRFFCSVLKGNIRQK